MNARMQLGRLRRQFLSSLYTRRSRLSHEGPIVSFTFDDFPRSALTAGGRILKSHGARGTYYAAVGLMNTVNHLGEQFRREDLDTLLSDGHELASHTFSHVSCRSVSCSKFQKDVREGRRAIEELTGRADWGNFAFPFGEITLKAKKARGAEMASCRSIWQGLNGPEVDLNLLRAKSLYGDLNKAAEELRELVLENGRQKTWLIFYSHDIREVPSPFGCTPELLEFVVSCARDSGARIMTVAEVVAGLSTVPVEKGQVSELAMGYLDSGVGR